MQARPPFVVGSGGEPCSVFLSVLGSTGLPPADYAVSYLRALRLQYSSVMNLEVFEEVGIHR